MKKFTKILPFLALMLLFFYWINSRTLKNISILHRERDEIYEMEALGFTGYVQYMYPGHHRGAVDTIIVRLTSWSPNDSAFLGEYFLKKLSDTALLLFINYSEALFPPIPLKLGDNIIKDKYTFDFKVYHSGQFKKTLSFLFCAYENPDTLIQNGDTITGMYGKGNWFGRDTLFRGKILNGKRQGVWKYYEAHSNVDKIFEGIYKGDLRNGVFRKYYPSSDLLVYEESYKDNLPDGSFTWWYRNRQVESKRYFKNGVPTGEWFFYGENGRLIKHEFH